VSARPRIGVIGTGWWGSQYHIPSLLTYEGATLVAISDNDTERLDLARRTFDVEHVFADPHELLAAGLVDGVVIATSHDAHFSLAQAALEAKLHTLVEKPLTIVPADAWKLVELAERNGVHLSVGYTAQYDRGAEFLKQALADGALGELVSINCLVATALEVLLRGDTARFATELPIPPPLAPKDGTYSDPARAGGGFAQTQLTHTIGMFLYVTGLAPAEVFARTASGGLDVELAVDAVFTLEDGTLGTLAGTGTLAAAQRQTHELRYYGSEAYAVQDILAGEVTVVSANGDEKTVGPTRRSEPLASRAPARAFADLIAGSGQNYAPGDVAARAVDFIAALYRSAESSRPEAIPPRPLSA
jgi:predicted dehydrogenase